MSLSNKELQFQRGEPKRLTLDADFGEKTAAVAGIVETSRQIVAGLRRVLSGPRRIVVALALLTLLVADFHESAAEQRFVKNGLRPGQRGRIDVLRPPSGGTRVRVRAPRRAAPPATPPAAPSATWPRAERQAWFWQAHSAAETRAPAARWAAALETVQGRRARGLGLFEPALLDGIRALYGHEVEAAARRHDISPALLLAVIAVESHGQPGAVSAKGAQGLMQLIPATARRFGVDDVFEPAANIAGGAAYLDWLLDAFQGDVLLALAGYNAGEGAVRRHDGVPPYAETRDYVALVMDAVAAAGALCDAPPAGPRLPCRWKDGI